MSTPNFEVWLPHSFVTLPTICHCFSFSLSGQLQRLALSLRLQPQSMSAWFPRIPKYGSPLVKFVSLLRFGIPASAAGVVPKSNGSTSTLYRNQPKRKSASRLDEIA